MNRRSKNSAIGMTNPAETLIPLRIELGVDNGVLDDFMPKVTLDGTRVFTATGKLKTFAGELEMECRRLRRHEQLSSAPVVMTEAPGVER